MTTMLPTPPFPDVLTGLPGPRNGGGMRLSRFLTRLVVVSLLPVVALALWLSADLFFHHQGEDRRQALGLAEDVAAAVDQYLSARIGALTMLAASPNADRPDSWPALYREAGEFPRSFGSQVVLASATEPMRMLFNTRVPLGTALPPLPLPAGRSAAVEARRQGRPEVGDLFTGPIANLPLTGVAVPVLRQGKVTAILLTTLEAAAFQQILDQIRLPPGWGVVLGDSAGAEIVRRGAAVTGEDEAVRFTVATGVAPWTATVAIPQALYWRSLLGVVAVCAAGVALVTLVGGLVGLFAARRLSATMDWLATAPAGAPPPLPVAEVIAARDRLDQTNARLRESEDRFRRMFLRSPVPMAYVEHGSERVTLNARFRAVFGYDEDDLVTLEAWWTLAYPDPAVRDRAQAAWAAARDVARGGGDAAAGPQDYPIACKDGMTRTIELSRIVLPDGILVAFHDVTARRAGERLQAELEKERGLLATLIHTIPDLVWLKDVGGIYLSCNHAFRRFIGRDEAEIVGRTDFDLLPRAQAEFFRAHDLKAIAAGRPTANEEWITFADDGQTALLETIKAPMLDGEGRVIGVLGIGRDITRRYQSELALRQSEERFRTYIEASPLAILITDGDGRLAEVNPAAVALLGWDAATLTGRSIADLVAEGDRTRALRDLVALNASGRIAAEYRLIGADGRQPWVSLAAVRIAPGRFAAFCQDITTRKAIEAELERHRQGLEQAVAARTAELESAEARLRLILESTADGLFGLDPAGAITFINPGGCALLGYRPEQLIGRCCHAVLLHGHGDGAPYAKADCPIEATLTGGEVRRVEGEVFRTADGRALPVSYSSHPMVQGGKIVGAVVSFTDISARQAAERAREAALAEAERLAGVRRAFLANMSHEIRTPLAAILGLAQIGQRRDGAGAEMCGRIIEAAHGLQDVVDDVLDFSKIESGKMTVERISLDLGEVIDRAVEMLALRAGDKGVHFTVHEAPDLPARCLGDPNRLRQVLVNLLSNAIKFTPAGGAVTLRAAVEADRLVLAVSDSGIGIAPEAVERLFKPFEQADGSTTRRFGGTGLGLSITHDLLGLMGGAIAVTSVPGGGSTFTVTLPLVGAEPPPPWPEGAVVLLGLPEDETAQMLTALPAARPLAEGVVRPLAGGATLPVDAALVVIDRAALADPATAAATAPRLAAGGAVAILADAGAAGVAEGTVPGCEAAVVLERPLRPRRLRRLLAEPARRQGAAAGTARLAGLRVLGAEDNPVNRLVLEDMLSGEGARLSCFDNGRLALEALRAADAGAFDVVVTDLHMPEMDGYDLARAVAAFAPGLPVIGLTADALGEETRPAGADALVERVVKPVQSDTLVAAILRHVAPPSAVPGFDPACLLARHGGRRDFVRRLAAAVVASHRDTPAVLRAAAAEGAADRLAALAHSLKGTAGNVGAEALGALAAEVERAARAGRPGPVEPLAEAVADLVAVLDRLDG
ncbi:PAS domain S-box protein [Phaeospirillum tilakii]|uniref:histidine kinase n=1 Tax=Phaeospirillum tilakii TaxID=741673 RepID=A0ABW5C7F1_9PROT